LILQSQNKDVFAKRMEGNNLRATGRTFLRLLMTKSLALQCSWSGFNHARRREKIAFSNHVICDFYQGKQVKTYILFM